MVVADDVPGIVCRSGVHHLSFPPGLYMMR